MTEPFKQVKIYRTWLPISDSHEEPGMRAKSLHLGNSARRFWDALRLRRGVITELLYP